MDERARQDSERPGQEISPEEFIRRRPEVSPEQGAAAGPDSPETIEPTQGQRPGAADRETGREGR